jgi:hypothetical protein
VLAILFIKDAIKRSAVDIVISKDVSTWGICPCFGSIATYSHMY